MKVLLILVISITSIFSKCDYPFGDNAYDYKRLNICLQKEANKIKKIELRLNKERNELLMKILEAYKDRNATKN